MTITLEIPPEAELTLAAQAEARGLSLDAYVRAIINLQARATESAEPPHQLEREDLDRLIDDVFDTVPVPPGVGQGAMRRENSYR